MTWRVSLMVLGCEFLIGCESGRLDEVVMMTRMVSRLWCLIGVREENENVRTIFQL